MSAKPGNLPSAEKCWGSEEAELWQVWGFFKFSRHKLLPSLLSAHNFVKGYCPNSNGRKSNIPVLIPLLLLFTILCFVLKHLKQRVMLIPPCEWQCLKNWYVFYFWHAYFETTNCLESTKWTASISITFTHVGCIQDRLSVSNCTL